MELHFHRAKVRLDEQRTIVLRDEQGLDLVGIGGEAWVTIDGDPRDVLLARGARLHVDAGDKVVVSGMPQAEVALVPASAPRAGRDRLAGARRRLREAWRSLQAALGRCGA